MTFQTNDPVRMYAIIDIINLKTEITDMKRNEQALMTLERLDEARQLGQKLARLRTARRIRQADAAMRAGISRSTAVLLEKGDLSRTQAQILRYLEAIAPGVSLLTLCRLVTTPEWASCSLTLAKYRLS